MNGMHLEAVHSTVLSFNPTSLISRWQSSCMPDELFQVGGIILQTKAAVLDFLPFSFVCWLCSALQLAYANFFNSHRAALSLNPGIKVPLSYWAVLVHLFLCRYTGMQRVKYWSSCYNLIQKIWNDPEFTGSYTSWTVQLENKPTFYTIETFKLTLIFLLM